METMTPILSARNVHICFNLRGRVLHAIRGIDLDVCRGEVLAIVGESGSGKSVFTKSFMGLLDANGSITEGTIEKKTVTLTALDEEGSPAASWRCINAWPVKYTAPDFNGTSSEIAVETIELAHEGLTRTD